MNELQLPDGTRLLHVGPHKTGTTALQGALAQAREGLPKHGVTYPGNKRQHAAAARAIVGGKGPKGDPKPSLRDWDLLVDQVNAAGEKKVIVSSESFANAETETARLVVEKLGGSRVHVLVTLRPLTKIMPSAWQQYVREGLLTSYDDWLDGMLNQAPYTRPTPSFWMRHRHDVLIERWASVVGPHNLTVVVLDETDRSMITRTVEQLVGLPAGFLVPEPGLSNRSLTGGEIELVRQLNSVFKRNNWSDDFYRTFIRYGMTRYLQATHQPGKDEPQITTPGWALASAAQIGAESADKIATLGVRVIGDLASLGARPERAKDEGVVPGTPVVPVSVARDAVTGTIAAGLSKLAATQEPSPGLPALNSIPTRDLARILLRRLRKRARRSIRTIRPVLSRRHH